MNGVDLHCHTYFSDGSDSPEEVIRLAIASGLSGLSITDHDTVEAYHEAIPFAEEHQFPLLPGVEFSSAFRGEAVHILGYAFSLKSEEILQLCQKHRLRRRMRNSKILEKLNQLGIPIDEEELKKIDQKNRTVGRPHIALQLVEKGVVGSIKEAFEKFLAEGKPAYDPGVSISLEETIDAIHKGGGKAILAHPHLIKRRSVCKSILEMPFDGIEGYYPRLALERKKQWMDLAEKKGWIITGGSDYHGKFKPQNRLGMATVGKEIFDKLYAHYIQVRTGLHRPN